MDLFYHHTNTRFLSTNISEKNIYPYFSPQIAAKNKVNYNVNGFWVCGFATTQRLQIDQLNIQMTKIA